MTEARKKLIAKAAGILEILFLSVIYYLVFDIYREVVQKGLFIFRGKYFLIGLYFVISYLTFKACESFRFDKLKFADVFLSQGISILLVNAITWVQICLIVNGVVTPGPMLLLTVIDLAAALLFSSLLTRYFRRNGGISDALLVYGTDGAVGLAEKIGSREGNYNVAEMIPSDSPFEELTAAVGRHSTVIINDVPAALRNDLLKYCFSVRKITYIVPKITDIIVKGAEEVSTFDTPLMEVRNEGLSTLENVLKRVFDLLFSGLVMIPGSVLMALVAVCIKLEDGGPVFYRQKRLTKDGRTFEILKFRSMIVNAEEATGAVLASEDDPRITKVGRFLRSCRLDEFPQFLNILKGEMSVVGPRPERVELTEEIVRKMPEFAYRLRVKGGLTGYAQVYGKYNTDSYDKLKLDLMYIENYSLLLDLKLVLMTPQILLRKEAAEGVKRPGGKKQ